MTDQSASDLGQRIKGVFRVARRITVMAQRGGRLVPVGIPRSDDILGVAMLLATVHMRVPERHPYVTPAIPGPALLLAPNLADCGALILAPVIEWGSPVGAVVVEAWRGLSFTRRDLALLQQLATLTPPVELEDHRLQCGQA